MAPPLYFFPAVTGDELKRGSLTAYLKRYKLDTVLQDIGDLLANCALCDLKGKGPGDKSGALLTTLPGGRAPVRIGFYPDFQRWQKVLAEVTDANGKVTTPELWIGIDKEHPPKPEDIERPSKVSGHKVRLADGNEWELPVIRSPVRSTGLPEDMFHDADGVFQTQLQPRWQELWDATEPVWDMCFSEEDGSNSMEFSKILDFCIRFLSVNYRYGPMEHAVLLLVNKSEATWNRLFEAVLDLPLANEMFSAQKKSDKLREDDTASSEPGSTDDTPATAPADTNSS